MADGSARIEFVWGDGKQVFRLPYKQIAELEDKVDAGIEELYNRIRLGKQRVEDIRQTIRLGLIGGGMEAEKAYTLVERYVDQRPQLVNKGPALAILGAALVGADDGSGDDGGDAAKKAEGESEKPVAPPSGS